MFFKKENDKWLRFKKNHEEISKYVVLDTSRGITNEPQTRAFVI